MRINWEQVVSFLIGAAIVLIILFALGIFPTHVNYCYETEAGHKECGAYNIGLVAFWQIEKGLNWIAPALGAIATIAVAIFTCTLWLSSKKMWEVTKKSVDIAERSLTELERPYLFILDYNWLLKKRAETNGMKSGLIYSVMNGGKLPAFVRNVKFGLSFGQSIPSMEDMPPINELLTAPLVGSGEKREIVQGVGYESGERSRECEIRGGIAIIPAGAFMFDRVIAKISIEYDGPVTTGHITTACWEWHPVKYAFSQYGGPEHNQRT